MMKNWQVLVFLALFFAAGLVIGHVETKRGTNRWWQEQQQLSEWKQHYEGAQNLLDTFRKSCSTRKIWFQGEGESFLDLRKRIRDVSGSCVIFRKRPMNEVLYFSTVDSNVYYFGGVFSPEGVEVRNEP